MYERLMIMLALCEPTLCNIEGDGGAGGAGDGAGAAGGGAGAGGTPKTFTQEELSRIAAKQKSEGEAAGRRAAETEALARQATLEAEAKAKLDAAEARIQELELAGKTQAERDAIERKQREEADKKAREAREQALAKERDDAKALAADREARWKGDRVKAAVTTALVTNKALASATPDAADTFVRVSKIETDDEGLITSVIYAGKSYASVDEATKEFLRERSHFAQASGTGGAGTRGGNGSGNGIGNKPLWQLSDEELKQLDHAQGAAK